MTGSYDISLVLLSIVIAIIASYTAIDLSSRLATTNRRASRYWLIGGSLAMGTGIWSMHFVGMLALHLEIPLAYDLPITIASWIAALVASGIALYLVRRGTTHLSTLLGGAVIMAAGITTMHYSGMAAMKMQPPIQYDPVLYTASIFIAFGGALIALWLTFHYRGTDANNTMAGKLIGASILGLGIAGMHYTGMAAALFLPNSICTATPTGIDTEMLGLMIGIGTLMILALTLVVSVFDARLADQNARMVEQLQQANVRLESRANELAQAMTRELRESATRNRLLATIVEQSSEAIITKDLNGRITSWNQAAEQMFGYAQNDIIGEEVTRLYAIQDESARRNMLERTRHNTTPQTFETRCIHKTGNMLDISASVSPLFDENNHHTGEISIIRDITAQKQFEAALFREKERAEVTLRSIGDAVITTDIDGHVEYLNPVAEELTGWPLHEAKGKPLTKVFRIVNEYTRIPVDNPVIKCLAEGRIVGLANHTTLLCRNGEELAIEDSAAPIRDLNGEVIGAVMVFHDVSQARELSKQLSWQATHDSLTGLVNRREFEQRLKQTIDNAQQDQVQHALLYIDLDQFKVVNDTCGHVAGDELLKQVTMLLRKHIRDSDTLARLGGDEFGMLLHNCPTERTVQIGSDIIDTVSNYRFLWEDKSFVIGTSIGIVTLHPGSGPIAEVMSKADIACYAAKEAGRNRLHLYEDDNDDLLRQHSEMQWVTRINDALTENRFELYGQAIQPTLNGKLKSGLHVEILLRLRDTTGELIAPFAFIPAAERYNLMPAIDRWVIQQLFERLCQKDRAIDKIELCCINLSGHTIGDERFADFVIDRLKELNCPAHKFCFEITETAAITNLTKAMNFITQLRKLGCKFALDDFGSGLSSFAYLKNLPVDYLKIDGAFVKDIANDPIDRAMVEAINQIGHVMGIETIAEFVENDEILAILDEMGVNYAQGYGIAMPQPLEEIIGDPRYREKKPQAS